MRTELIVVPYLLGREGVGMGAGPLALAPDLERTLRPAAVHRLALREPFGNEVGACFALNRELAETVAAARARGALPVVLTGNCHSQQAVVAGIGPRETGLVWFDAHADFHTPETTTSGFFDGQGLALVAGQCWSALAATVPGFAPLPEERIALVGVRDTEAGERARLDASQIADVPVEAVGTLAAHVARIRDAAGAAQASVHVDLDVLDPSAGRANQYATGAGLTREQLVGAAAATAAELPVAALTFSAYDPAFDPERTVPAAALAVAAAVIG